MRYFPIFVDSTRLNVLLVGAGEVAARKLELLLKTKASITVVAPWVSATVEALAASTQVGLQRRRFADDDLDGRNMVVVATDDEALNARISDMASARQIQVNVVDNTPLCSFITPSIIDRSPLVIAMSSGGVAPVLLRYLRQKLEALIPQKIAKLGTFSEKFRDQVKLTLSSVTQRRYFWESVLEGDIAEQVLSGNEVAAEKAFQLALTQHDQGEGQGTVYLVGAGPGDPELLTFKALRLMQKADVVVYDRLVSEEILELVRRDAEKIYVGKAKSHHTLPQENINQLLVDKAKQGLRVVRLKGGDPFIFGRGGEELQTLVEHCVPFQVVPGITAASGAGTYAGIPLTHRDHAQSVTFATGHLKDNGINLDWQALARPGQTLVFYMGLTGLGIISRELTQRGIGGQTPVAIIESATTANQRTLVGTLEDIESKARQAQIKPPALIIVGTVVSLHNQLNWLKTS